MDPPPSRPGWVVMRLRCDSKASAFGVRRAYSIAAVPSAAFGVALDDPIHATWTVPPEPTAKCGPRMVPVATALPGTEFTRRGKPQVAPLSVERTYRMSADAGPPVR